MTITLPGETLASRNLGEKEIKQELAVALYSLNRLTLVQAADLAETGFFEFQVYVLQSDSDGKLYVGCTKDLRERFRFHNEGKVPATAKRTPLRLIYYEACLEKADAFRREKYLKTSYGKRYIKSRCRNYFTGLVP